MVSTVIPVTALHATLETNVRLVIFFVITGQESAQIAHAVHSGKIIFYFTDIDDCVNNTCVNGGSCVDGVNSYSCNCSAGYSGDRCQTGNTCIL